LPVDIPIAVIARVSLGDPLGDALSHVRKWLDSKKIRPASLWSGLFHVFFPTAAAAYTGWQVSPFQLR
jgi:hypothetical protein